MHQIDKMTVSSYIEGEIAKAKRELIEQITTMITNRPIGEMRYIEQLQERISIIRSINELAPLLTYDATYGDGKECECGHPYFRHFDTYENMRAVGCKYCPCDRHKEKE